MFEPLRVGCISLHLNEDGARARKQSSPPSAGRCLTGPAFGGFCSTENDARYGTAAACQNRYAGRSAPEIRLN